MQQAQLVGPAAGLYGQQYSSFEAAYRRSLEQSGCSEGDVAEVICRALEAVQPGARYIVGGSNQAMVAMRKLLPDRAWDRVVNGIKSV